MDNQKHRAGSAAFAARMLAHVLVRPRLLVLLPLVGWRFRRRGWYRRWPFLPLPPASYVAWRMHTAFGAEDTAPDAKQAELYLRWAQGMGQR